MHGLKQKQTAKTHYRQVGEQLASERLATMEEQLSKFRKVLEDFAFRHKEDIKKDPIFRKHFHEMCASIGVDPLASNKGESLAKLQKLQNSSSSSHNLVGRCC